MRLSPFQNAFAAALWGGGGSDGALHSLADMAQHPGFAVYRNTVIKGCIDALQANYPTVCALVGEAWFRAAARLYAQASPPSDARLMRYGEGFAEFLAQFEPAAELPYLADIARLDRCWTESHLAADAPTLCAHWLAQQSATDLSTLAIAPHPAARWYRSAVHPAFALWQAHREGHPLAADTLQWHADSGLLTRAQGAVQWTRLPAGGAEFLEACAQGEPLQDAALAALAAEPGADLAALMALLLQAGALASMHTASPEPEPAFAPASQPLHHAPTV
jgi:hypothetical protein